MTDAAASIVVLVCADAEWRVVRRTIKTQRVRRSPFGEWFAAWLGAGRYRTRVLFCQTGCGKIPAAAATQHVIYTWNPGLIVNLGTCGGFGGHVNAGDTLLVTRTVVYDIIERTGRAREQIEKVATDVDLSWLTEPCPVSVTPAVMATADQDLDPANMAALNADHGAVAADWESGAIAYVVARNRRCGRNVRLLILRGVSDVVEEGGRPSREAAIERGGAAVMRRLLRDLPLWVVRGEASPINNAGVRRV